MLEHVRPTAAPVAALGLALLLLGAPRPAAGQAAVDVDITLPEMLVLHYFSGIELTLDANDLVRKAFRTAGVPDIDHGTGAATGLDSDLGIDGMVDDPLGPQSPNSLRFGRGYFGDVWAVRAVSPGGSTRVRVTVDNATATHASGATLRATDARLLVNGGPNGRDVSFNSPGLANPRRGSLRVTVDLTNANQAGWYRGIRLLIVVEHL